MSLRSESYIVGWWEMKNLGCIFKVALIRFTGETGEEFEAKGVKSETNIFVLQMQRTEVTIK